MKFLHRLNVLNDDVFEKPGGRFAWTRVIMPDTNAMQKSQRSKDVFRFIWSLRRSESVTSERTWRRRRFHHVEESFDEDRRMFLPMFDRDHQREWNEPNNTWIDHQNPRERWCYVGFRSGIRSSTRENKNLVEVLICCIVIRHRCYSQLQTRRERERHAVSEVSIQSSIRYFLGIFLILVATKDQESDVKSRHGDDCQIHRLILHEISIGKHIAPVDRLW